MRYHNSRPAPSIQLQLQMRNSQGKVVVEVGPSEYSATKIFSNDSHYYTNCPRALLSYILYFE